MKIFTMDGHNEAYHRWKEQGVKDRIVVHIDAHVDFGPAALKSPMDLLKAQSRDELYAMLRSNRRWKRFEMPESERIHIGNYLHPAIIDGIAREIWWIVPDAFFSEKGKRRLLKKTLTLFKRRGFLSHVRGTIEEGLICGDLCHCPFHVTTLAGLPRFGEDVLLDIDTDFLIPNSVWGFRRGYHIPSCRRPWIWPDELVSRLKASGITSDLVTIAFSVEGGFTPLWARHLGNETAALLKNDSRQLNLKELYAERRRGLIAKCSLHVDQAMTAFERALELNPSDAPSLFNLAILSLDKGDIEKAHTLYQKCIQIDQTYLSEYATDGIAFEVMRRFRDAEREFRGAVALDPNSADAHTNLANMLMAQKRDAEAHASFKKAIALDPTHPRALTGIGLLHMKKRDYDTAVTLLEQVKANGDYYPSSSLWMGLACLKKRRLEAAEESLLEFIRSGRRSIRAHFLLALVYFRQNNWYGFLHEVKRLLVLSPGSFCFSLKTFWIRVVENQLMSNTLKDA